MILDKKGAGNKMDEPIINEYEIEFRGRIVTKLNLNQAVPIRRYRVIASSFEEALDLIKEFEDDKYVNNKIVSCTMRLA